jgi:hypothetical protein
LKLPLLLPAFKELLGILLQHEIPDKLLQAEKFNTTQQVGRKNELTLRKEK